MEKRCVSCKYFDPSSTWAGTCTFRLPPWLPDLVLDTFTRADASCDLHAENVVVSATKEG